MIVFEKEFYEKYRDFRLEISALAELDNIDWSSLNHAYGEASDFPILINAALSDDKYDREYAVDSLLNTLCHQGSVYPATIIAIPFIAGLLQSRDVANQADFALLLSEIARRSLDDWNDYQENERTVEMYAKAGLNLKEINARHKQWDQEVHERAIQYLHLLYPFLNNGKDGLKLCIANCLACYPELGSQTLPLLIRCAEEEKDEEEKMWILQTIQKLQKSLSSKK